MTLTYRVVTSTIKSLTRILCRVDDAQLTRVPDRGPLIIVANHVNFLEVPLLYTHLQPRSVTGFAKAETWDNPALGALFDLGRAIPLRRGEADMDALRKGFAVLEEGGILAVAPEGTRSRHGRLLRARPGVVMIALHSGATILPIAHWGGESFGKNIKRMKRTDFHVKVGQPFRLQADGKMTRQARKQAADEIMLQIAALLPQEYHGEYAGKGAALKYLQFT